MTKWAVKGLLMGFPQIILFVCTIRKVIKLESSQIRHKFADDF